MSETNLLSVEIEVNSFILMLKKAYISGLEEGGRTKGLPTEQIEARLIDAGNAFERGLKDTLLPFISIERNPQIQ